MAVSQIQLLSAGIVHTYNTAAECVQHGLTGGGFKQETSYPLILDHHSQDFFHGCFAHERLG
jgi:hypothetical protein